MFEGAGVTGGARIGENTISDMKPIEEVDIAGNLVEVNVAATEDTEEIQEADTIVAEDPMYHKDTIVTIDHMEATNTMRVSHGEMTNMKS